MDMNANYILLYVDSPAKSRDFYQEILGQKPVEDSATFVLFVLPSGVKFGLWGKNGVVPTASAPGGCEIGFPVDTVGDVDRIAGEWKDRGLKIIQKPEDVDFGRTFTALDPDGHRLRVLCVDMAQ
jgi:catechol 2,3-dioxygenase-like lactoylglutathione lyase family enzyme